MTTLDQKIRERLATAEHEDWCDARIQSKHAEECNCFLGPTNNAIRAVLDVAQMADQYSVHPEDIGYRAAMREVQAAISTALGITQDGRDV